MAVVLIIDDDEMIVESLSILLQNEGYDVLSSSNGKNGLKLLGKNRIDVVITDIIMPDKDGIETIREIKKTYRNTKIIAMSGGGKIAAKEYLTFVKQLGVRHTLSKPFEKEQILSALEAVLREPKRRRPNI